MSLNTNGGSIFYSEAVPFGGTLVSQYIPVKECCSFEGWYYDSALTQAYKKSDPIKQTITLYAKWGLRAQTH
ncbi:InlB B-repeat-containing protein [Paenibacillus sp. UNC499MF]|uniref:InlB B-repeat-containing protein n=1 Tax=Paenibacillus sp. UNC499MF TaxID=1502751 RepID=UPI0015E1C368